MSDKWKVIISKSPTKRELSTWTEKQWITFLQFCLFFIVVTDEKTTISVTDKRWKEAEEFLEMPDHPFQEFLYRINFFTFDPKADRKKFYFKLVSIMKFTLGYLKINPSLITDEMKKIIEPNDRLNWCLKQTKIIETNVGPVVAADNVERVTSVHKNMNIANYEQQLVETMIKTTNLLDRMVEAVGKKDLSKMETKDLLLAVSRMSYVFSLGKNMRPNKNVFKQIVVNNAGREELEKAMLNFNQDE